jgi:hypothetical protein
VLIYRSDAERTRTSSTRGLSILAAPMPIPAFAARQESAHLNPARLGHPTMTAGWRAGAMQVQQVQGGRIVGCDVTDNAFSTRMGPPSCSPPV